MIHLGHKALRVVGIRDDDADQPPVLVVEDAPNEPLAGGEFALYAFGHAAGRLILPSGSSCRPAPASRPRVCVVDAWSSSPGPAYALEGPVEADGLRLALPIRCPNVPGRARGGKRRPTL